MNRDLSPCRSRTRARFRVYPWCCRSDSRGRGENPRSRKVRTPQGKGGRGNPTRGNPRESATENNRLSGEIARASRRRQGRKGAVRAHRRRGDTAARQTPPGARPSRDDDAARRVPGRPQGREAPPERVRWMTADDEIRLTGQLREAPADAGASYFAGAAWAGGRRTAGTETAPLGGR